ncbi:MAG: hypothetical protein H6660_07195 [Ardenticatenaceae bacterium]|nr:hypothetical protein [Ardenticatenaceae bacterium]
MGIEEELDEGKGQGNGRLRTIALLLLLFICLGSLLLVRGNSAVPTSGVALGARMCAGIATKPMQIGIAWALPISSYLPPIMFSRYKVCIDLPPALSPSRINGQFVLPP